MGRASAAAERRLSVLDRWRLRRALKRGAEVDLAAMPGPRGVGRVARGRDMTAGEFVFAGYLVEAPGTAIWDLPVPDAGFAAEIQGFGWLDDLAAAADEPAETRARDWTDAWLARFGRGDGPGWRPDLLGRRIQRWIDHADILMGGEAPRDARLRRSLRAQAHLLARRWRQSRRGMPRIEAVSGLLLATTILPGLSAPRGAALDGLMRQIAESVTEDGGMAERNPERLATLFAHLVRIRVDLEGAGIAPPSALGAAIAAMAPVLRTLRHADGGLARFHGGGRGLPGRLDHALAHSGVAPGRPGDRALGYARLCHGRTSLILDAAAPPGGAAAREGHASTLAFELTSGRRPIIVNCGAGHSFGDRWRRAGRATPSHSTLVLGGLSSSRLAGKGDAERLRETPGDVRIEARRSDAASGLIAGHDGYVATHGLTHVREIHLDRDGRGVRGEDVIATVEREDERIFDRALDSGDGRVAFRVHFHLHPAVTARPGADGRSVELMPKSGELWVFRHEGSARVRLDASVYLDAEALNPQPTRQIILDGQAIDYATRVRWTLAKAEKTPDAVRDIVHDDRPVLV